MADTKTTKTTERIVSREDIKEYYDEWLVASASQFHNIKIDVFACSTCISYLSAHNPNLWLYYKLPEVLHMDSETFSIYKEWWRLGSSDTFEY